MKYSRLGVISVFVLMFLASAFLASAGDPGLIGAYHNDTDGYLYDGTVITFFVNVSENMTGGYVLANLSYINGTTELFNMTRYPNGDNVTFTNFFTQIAYNHAAVRAFVAAAGTFQGLTGAAQVSQVTFYADDLNGSSNRTTFSLNASTVNNLTGYNFSGPANSSLPSFLAFGELTTNYTTILNWANVMPFVIDVRLNFSAMGIDFTDFGLTSQGTNFSRAALIEFNALNMTSSTIGTQLAALGTAIQVNISLNKWGNSSINVNSSTLSSFNTRTNVTLYNLPFKGSPVVAGTNGTIYVYGPGGGNLTFNVTSFSQYNASDTTAPIFEFIAPKNSTGTNTAPFLNVTFNGTGTDIRNGTINVTITGPSGYSNYYNYSNMSCNYTSTTLEKLFCSFTLQALPANGTYRITATVQDFGLSENTGNSGTAWSNFTAYTGPPGVASVTLNDTSPTKAGNVNFSVVFNRLMNTSLFPNVTLKFGNGDLNRSVFNGSYINDTAGTSTFIGNYTFYTAYSSTLDGPVIINISGAKDVAGNEMGTNDTNSFTLDMAPPDIRVSFVNNTNQSHLNLFFNFTDNQSSTASCRLYLNQTLNATNTSVNNVTNTTITITAASIEGVFNWSIECNDTADNRANSTSLYNILNIDQTAPTINASRASPLSGHYVNFTNNAATGAVIVNQSAFDLFTGLLNSTTGASMWVYKNGGFVNTYTIGTNPAIILNGTVLFSYQYSLNLSAATALASGDVISVILNVTDHARNNQRSNTTFTIDTEPPSLGAATLDAGSYLQGNNFTLTLSVNDTTAGLSKVNATFGVNVSVWTTPNVNLVCTGNQTATCTYSYNTTNLPAGQYQLTGNLTAVDNTDNANNNNRSLSIAFAINSTGAAPSIKNVTSNVTRIVKDLNVSVRLNVTVNDSNGVETIWATYDGNGTSMTCTVFSGGAITNTLVTAIGNCTILANTSGTTVSNNALTLSVYANNTLGTSSSATSYLIYLENSVINVSAFTAPSTAFENQTIVINTTVFSWHGSPKVVFNATNGTGIDVTLNTTCIVVDLHESLYHCTNTTNISATGSLGYLSARSSNTSTIRIINASVSGVAGATDDSLPSALTMGVYAPTTVNLTSVPATSTITFVESGVVVSGADRANTSAALQNISITDTTLNNTVIRLNSINASAISFFNLSIVAPNSSNGTNYSVIQTSLGASTATLLTSIVITPMINNISTGFTGSTIAFNCTALGVTCSASTRVYKADFSAATNLTTGAWAVISDANTAWSSPILTVTVNSFSIFALATPVTAATTTTTSSSSGGGGGGGIVAGVTTTAGSKTQVWTVLNKGAIGIMNINNDAIAITKVKFTAQNKADKPEMTIASLKAKPEEVSDASKAVYQYMEITKKILKDEDIADASLEFRVTKKWLSDNGIHRNDVVLLRYADGKWNELPTTLVKDSNGEVYYKATTPGFSYFAVGVKEGAAVTPKEEAAEEAAEEEAAEATPPTAGEAARKIPLLAWIIIAAIVVLLIVIYAAVRKKTK